MRYFFALALTVAIASATVIIKPSDLVGLPESQLAEIQQILEAIQSPSTDPTTAVMLEQLLSELLGLSPVKPPINIPAIIDEVQPIDVGPAIVEDLQPVDISPEIVDFPIPDSENIPQALTSSPLVQIIVKVNQADFGAVSPVQVVQPEVPPTPVQVVDIVGESIIKPTPVIVVDEAFEPQPEPILIGNLPEAVVVSPVVVAPAVVGPETLN